MLPELHGASARDILDLAVKHNVRFLRLQFTDILGVNKNVEVPASHPAAHLLGADNLFAFTTARYQRPLVIQGAGAGPEVTAQALLGDVLALA